MRPMSQSPKHRDPSPVEYQETAPPGLVKVMAGAIVSAPGWICLGVFLGWVIWT